MVKKDKNGEEVIFGVKYTDAWFEEKMDEIKESVENKQYLKAIGLSIFLETHFYISYLIELEKK